MILEKRIKGILTYIDYEKKSILFLLKLNIIQISFYILNIIHDILKDGSILIINFEKTIFYRCIMVIQLIRYFQNNYSPNN